MNIWNCLMRERTRPRHLLGCAVALALCGGAAAWACGFDFQQLLMDREAALRSPISLDFGREARQIVASGEAKLPVQAGDAVEDENARAQAEQQGVSAAQFEHIQAMRKAPDAQTADLLGADLPMDIRRYTAAAVAFGLAEPGDCADPRAIDDSLWDQEGKPREPDDTDLSPVVARFESVLALPAQERLQRGAWAAFALGRLMAQHCRWAEAANWFQRTRQLVAEGAQDPLSLGIASLGEEARVRWNQGRIEQTVSLYAEQAARGSDRGVNSLRHMADHVLSRPSLWQPRMKDQTLQKVLTRYALFEADAAIEASRTSTEHEAEKAPLRTGAAVLRWVDAVSRLPADALADPDTLAALSLALGRWDQARRLAVLRDTTLAHWVQGKIALRDGDSALAVQQYRLAVDRLRSSEHPLPAGHSFVTEEGYGGNLSDVLQAEQGILSLSRGDFVQALDQLYGVGGVYWAEVAYVAERVLTIEELKAYVDARVPGGADQPAQGPREAWPGRHPAAQLRTLLARRLMRAHRYDEALRYFHADGDDRFTDPHARLHAQAYVRALRQAPRAWTKIGRAEALFEAATLMREHGMDIVGYELGPDGAIFDGAIWVDMPRPEPASLSTPAERQRVAQSGPSSLPRYHYRALAADQAERAAANLPPRSEAYAVVMCWAASWRMASGDQKGAWRVYKTYVKRGPSVSWSNHFGRDCPKPDFTEAWRARLSGR
jgi:hypothetical protein